MKFYNSVTNKIENNKELFWNIIGSIGIKGLAMIISLLMLPAYLHYFSDQRILGIWFAILSILNWVLTFDLGIGNGLRNHLVEALITKNNEKIKKYVSSAYISIGGISIIIGIVGYLLIRISNWNTILNISEDVINNEVLIKVVQLILFGVLMQLFLRLILSILYALQKTALSNFISLLSNSLILLFLIIYKNDDVIESFKTIAFVYVFTINVPLLIATFVVFATSLKESKPNFKYYRKEYSRNILKLGSMFLGIQLSLLLINSTNEILITRLYSPVDVVHYQVYNRVFSIFLTLFSLLTIPIWSSVTKAYTENRIGWIKSMYKYLNFVGIGISLIIFLIIIIFQDIVDLWLGDKSFKIEYTSALIFGIFNVIMIFIYSVNCIANGLSKLKPQLIFSISAALLKIPLAILLSKYFEHWIIIMIVNIVVMFPGFIIQPIALNRVLNRLTLKSKTICKENITL